MDLSDEINIQITVVAKSSIDLKLHVVQTDKSWLS